MSVIQELSRYDVLLSQFPFEENLFDCPEYAPLVRIFHFLYENSSITNLAFLREETLVQYIKFHRFKQFEIISFTQAIQDIKIFAFYLRNKRGINKELRLDMSIKNYHFWIHL